MAEIVMGGKVIKPHDKVEKKSTKKNKTKVKNKEK